MNSRDFWSRTSGTDDTGWYGGVIVEPASSRRISSDMAGWMNAALVTLALMLVGSVHISRPKPAL